MGSDGAHPERLDDETQLILPPSAVYPFAARWIGNGIYLLGVPAADRWLLGARLTAVDWARPLRSRPSDS